MGLVYIHNTIYKILKENARKEGLSVSEYIAKLLNLDKEFKKIKEKNKGYKFTDEDIEKLEEVEKTIEDIDDFDI